MKIVQYLPTFLEGFTPEVVEFETIEELLEVPFVKNFARPVLGHEFSGYARDVRTDHFCLMAIYNNGKDWWVVGRITGGIVDLPVWRANEPPAA